MPSGSSSSAETLDAKPDSVEAPSDEAVDRPPLPRDPWRTAGLEGLRRAPKMGWPVQSVHITSTFGWRVDPVSGVGVRLHRGTDFRGRIGDLVLSVADGTIEFAGHDPLLGNMVIVDHGDGLTSLYGHLSDVLVTSALPVSRGTAIGLVGNTGRSAAPHLHLTMKVDDVAVDPLLLLGQPPHQPRAWSVKPAEPEPEPGPGALPPPAESTTAAGEPAAAEVVGVPDTPPAVAPPIPEGPQP